jgi:hypothetical protein
LISRDGAGLSVPPPEKTLLRLDDIWANFFPRRTPAAAASPPPLATELG